MRGIEYTLEFIDKLLRMADFLDSILKKSKKKKENDVYKKMIDFIQSKRN